MEQSNSSQREPSQLTPILEKAAKTIAETDRRLGKDQKNWAEAIAIYDQTISDLANDQSGESDARRHLTGWAQMGRGNALAASDMRGNLESAIASYEQAVASLGSMTEPSPSHIGDLAAVWSNMGHAISRIATKDELAKAGDCFRKAIDLLNGLSQENNARDKHHLAAAWLNLANTQSRSAPPSEPSNAALESFEHALAAIEGLSIDDPAIATLAASIHSSRGKALHWAADNESLDQALVSFHKAIAILDKLPKNEDPRIALELASVHANRANLLTRAVASKDSIQGALASAEVALALSAPSEQQHLFSAETSISARRSICHCFGLIVGGQDSEKKQEIHDKASDLIEDGINLIKLWESRKATGLRGSAQHLFHLGCAFYGTQQPHFLSEFIGENSDLVRSDPIMIDSATKIIREVISRIQKKETKDSSDQAIADSLDSILQGFGTPA